MRTRSRVLHALAISVTATTVVACGSSDPAQQDAAAQEDAAAQYDAPRDGGTVSPDSGGPTIGLGMMLQDFATGDPLDGVQCCLDGTTKCATSSASGQATIGGVPASTEISVTCSLAGYMTRSKQYTTGLTNIGGGDSMFAETLISSWAQAAGVTLDPAKALVFVQGAFIDQHRTGVTFSLTPASGVGPVYFNNSGVPDSAVTDTAAQPYALIFNVDPGDYVFVATSANGCAYLAPYGWEGQTADTLRVHAVAGTLGNAFLNCQ
jgi:hypothetical protein